jgi:hypothetical protein
MVVMLAVCLHQLVELLDALYALHPIFALVCIQQLLQSQICCEEGENAAAGIGMAIVWQCKLGSTC